MIKFPSINQFRNTRKMVSTVLDCGDRTISFTGSVKLHGTNAALAFTGPNKQVTYQSRSRELSVTDDNAGFCNYMSELGDTDLQSLAEPYFTKGVDQVILFGEWCGGNIQKGIALSQLEKMFVIFAVRVIRGDECSWVQINPNTKDECFRIFNIKQFGTYSINIDFSNPEASVNEMVAITQQVEAECPVGKYFGASGIGEGVVWTCDEYPSSDLWFKVKGEKHSVSKVKTLVEVDTVKLKSVTEFVDRVVTQARVDQGITELGCEPTRKDTGTFLSWFFADVMKEESDVLEASGLTKKDVSARIGECARGMFFEVTDN